MSSPSERPPVSSPSLQDGRIASSQSLGSRKRLKAKHALQKRQTKEFAALQKRNRFVKARTLTSTSDAVESQGVDTSCSNCGALVDESFLTDLMDFDAPYCRSCKRFMLLKAGQWLTKFSYNTQAVSSKKFKFVKLTSDGTALAVCSASEARTMQRKQQSKLPAANRLAKMLAFRRTRSTTSHMSSQGQESVTDETRRCFRTIKWKKVLLEDVLGVVFGAYTFTFKRLQADFRPPHWAAFSLVLKSRTYDFSCAHRSAIECFTIGLQELLPEEGKPSLMRLRPVRLGPFLWMSARHRLHSLAAMEDLSLPLTLWIVLIQSALQSPNLHTKGICIIAALHLEKKHPTNLEDLPPQYRSLPYRKARAEQVFLRRFGLGVASFLPRMPTLRSIDGQSPIASLSESRLRSRSVLSSRPGFLSPRRMTAPPVNPEATDDPSRAARSSQRHETSPPERRPIRVRLVAPGEEAAADVGPASSSDASPPVPIPLNVRSVAKRRYSHPLSEAEWEDLRSRRRKVRESASTERQQISSTKLRSAVTGPLELSDIDEESTPMSRPHLSNHPDQPLSPPSSAMKRHEATHEAASAASPVSRTSLTIGATSDAHSASSPQSSPSPLINALVQRAAMMALDTPRAEREMAVWQDVLRRQRAATMGYLPSSERRRVVERRRRFSAGDAVPQMRHDDHRQELSKHDLKRLLREERCHTLLDRTRLSPAVGQDIYSTYTPAHTTRGRW
ncbi:unnamed protein product [Vitrella brassicaformis CCMP3155]|uniref:Uncharacterized protein n=2 Tax=Vitrella brassicaformis TaxID=1169539 RepID=A0A0G4GM93_VITBC|nr:unnamed protein product [Vitrella brassicaformis CCMP3155]|eukprot:CEM31327.1 unnamed protein product [Vitrella brassicaformis CCMP3155]